MIMHRAAFTNYLRLLALGLVGLLVFGCSDDDNLVGDDPLCGGESGVGIHVEGRAQPVDVCVSDAAVEALLTSGQRYDVAAGVTLDDQSTVQLHLLFSQQAAPVTLQMTTSITEATNDPSKVFVYYQEVPGGGSPIESTAITGGTFRLTFNDDQVAVGTMDNIRLGMNDVQSGDPAGQRQIVDGYFSVTVTPAVAAVELSTH